jgi:hypothetical protein
MYYVMTCLSPDVGYLAMLSYEPDHPSRSWAQADKFSTNPEDPAYLRAPPEPVRAQVKKNRSGVMAEFWDDPVPLMTKRLFKALEAAGVRNIDLYKAEIFDPNTGTTYKDYVAFNIVGKVAAADLARASVDTRSPERMIAMDFNSLAIDEAAAGGALLFRLAESVNAIVVHERVKNYLEANGINTLTFIEPEDWAG